MKFKCTELITGKVLHLKTPWGITFQNTSVLVQYAFPLWFMGLFMQRFSVILNCCLKPCLTIFFINYLPWLWDRLTNKYMDPWCSNLYHVLRKTDTHVISESVKNLFSFFLQITTMLLLSELPVHGAILCLLKGAANPPARTSTTHYTRPKGIKVWLFIQCICFFFVCLFGFLQC